MKPSQQRHAERYFIQAGTFVQAANYARNHNLPPNKWTYLDRPDKLRGHLCSSVLVVKTGTYWEHEFAREIDELIVITCVESEYDLRNQLTSPNK